MSSMYGSNRTATGAGAGSGNRIPEGYQAGRMQNFTPEMMQLFQHLFGQVGPESFTSRLAAGDQSTFEEMEKPALKQFTGEIGNLASRFSGMGSGARRSSGFQNSATSAASDFSERLQSRRQDLQRQAIGDLSNMGNTLLQQRPYDNFLTKKPDFLSQLLGGSGDVVDMLTKILPFLMG